MSLLLSASEFINQSFIASSHTNYIHILSSILLECRWSIKVMLDCILTLIRSQLLTRLDGVFRLGFIFMFLSSWGFLMGCFASLEKNRQKYLLHLLNRQNQRLILIIFNTLYFRLVCKKYRSKQRNPKREKTLHFYPSDLLNFFFG